MKQLIVSIYKNPDDIERIILDSPFYDKNIFELTDLDIEIYKKYFRSFGRSYWTMSHSDGYGADDGLPYRSYYVLAGIKLVGTEFQFVFREERWKLFYIRLDDTYIFDIGLYPIDSLGEKIRRLADSLKMLKADSAN